MTSLAFRLPLTLLLTFAVAFASTRAQAPQRSLFVSAVDDNGLPVKDLKLEDFQVREDGMAREVLKVRFPADTPIHAAVLVDNSQGADPNIRDMRAALKQFVGDMTPKHSLALVTYGERPTILVDYTNSQATLLKGVDRIVAYRGSGAYLLEALVDVSRGLRRKEVPRGVIITVTATGPEFSNQHHTEVLQALRDSGAALHVLDFEPGKTSGDTEAIRSRGIVLDEGPRKSGGRHDSILTSMAFEGKLRSIAAELNHQYVVVYSRPESLIPPETLDVKVSRPGVTVRATPARATKGRS